MSKVTGPHRDLKIQRLRAAIELIPSLAARAPELEDSEYKLWRSGIVQVLGDLFGFENHKLGYLGRFNKIRVHSTVVQRGYGNQRLVFQSDYQRVWQRGLAEAEVVLKEALAEAELGPTPPRIVPAVAPAPPEKPLVININNTISNAFSPSVHVTFEQLVGALDSLELSPAERTLAKEELALLDEETRGAQRWPVLAKSLETLKGIGKGVYKEIAVPLIVEYLKQQSGLTSPPRSHAP